MQYAVIISIMQPSPGANPFFSIGKSSPEQKRASMLYSWCDTGSCISFATHRPSYLIQRFRTLIRQFKGRYSTVPLSNLWASRTTRDFWHCFSSSTVVSWQQIFHIRQLYIVFSSQLMSTHFSDIVSVVQWHLEYSAFCHANWWHWWNFLLLFCCFWSNSPPPFGLVSSRFLKTPNNITHYSFRNFYFLFNFCAWIYFNFKEETSFKSILKKIFGYT